MQCVSARVLQRVCSLLAEDFHIWGHGLPDLFLWNPATNAALLVEVKVCGGESASVRTRGCVFVCVGVYVYVRLWVDAGSRDSPSHARNHFLSVSVTHIYSVVHTYTHAHTVMQGPGDSVRHVQTAIVCLLLSVCCLVQNVLLLACMYMYISMHTCIYMYISMHTYGNAGAGR